MLCNHIDEKMITDDFKITEINLFSDKQISRSTQHIELVRKTSSFSTQKREKRTKTKFVQMNETRFSVDVSTKKSEAMNINDTENQKTIIQIRDLSIQINKTFLFSKFSISMSNPENLFVQQNNSVSADSSKKTKSFKKTKSVKKKSKKEIRKFSYKNNSKTSNARCRSYYVETTKEFFTQLFVQKIFEKIHIVLKKKTKQRLWKQKFEQCHAVFCRYILRQIKRKNMQKSFFDNEINDGFEE